MKNTALAIATAVTLLLTPLSGLAQGPAGHRGPGPGWGRDAGPEDLDLSPEQKNALRKAEEGRGDSLRLLRNQWMSKRLELQSLLGDSKVGEDAIRAKAKELFAVQADLQRAVLEHQLQVRAVLTPDQLGRWYAGPARRRSGGWGPCLEP